MPFCRTRLSPRGRDQAFTLTETILAVLLVVVLFGAIVLNVSGWGESQRLAEGARRFEALVCMAYQEAKNAFTIPGLGKLVLVKRKARMGRNPATGESIQIPAKRGLKFRVAKAAKDAVTPPKG